MCYGSGFSRAHIRTRLIGWVGSEPGFIQNTRRMINVRISHIFCISPTILREHFYSWSVPDPFFCRTRIRLFSGLDKVDLNPQPDKNVLS